MESSIASIKQVSDKCDCIVAETACEILTAVYNSTDFVTANIGNGEAILFGPPKTDSRLVKLIIKSIDNGSQSGYDKCYTKYKDIIESFFDARHDILKEESTINV